MNPAEKPFHLLIYNISVLTGFSTELAVFEKQNNQQQLLTTELLKISDIVPS